MISSLPKIGRRNRSVNLAASVSGSPLEVPARIVRVIATRVLEANGMSTREVRVRQEVEVAVDEEPVVEMEMDQI